MAIVMNSRYYKDEYTKYDEYIGSHFIQKKSDFIKKHFDSGWDVDDIVEFSVDEGKEEKLYQEVIIVNSKGSVYMTFFFRIVNGNIYFFQILRGKVPLDS